MTVDPQSYKPAYLQLADLIRASIDSGELAAGSPLPSEAALVQQYGFARETVRKAVSVLRHEGLVVTKAGRGSFVRGEPTPEIVEITAPARISARMPTVDERRQRNIPDGVPILVIHRDNEPDETHAADRAVLAVN